MSRDLKVRLIGFVLLLAAVGILAITVMTKPLRVVDAGPFITDFRDDRRLAGGVHDIFVGRVVSKAGNKSLQRLPETQFQVDVLETIKGNLSGTVVVNQLGGYRGNQLVLFEGDKLLEIGKTYLFATRNHPEEDWHTLVSGYGDLLISNEAGRASLTARFRKAVNEEIPLPADPGVKIR